MEIKQTIEIGTTCLVNSDQMTTWLSSEDIRYGFKIIFVK